jgi:hypothetical protein
MKRLVLFTILALSMATLYSQTTPIPDPAFEAKLISLGIDTNGMNGNILNSDAAGVNFLNVNNSGISDLSGIEAFVDITILDCEENMLTSLDLTFNTMLVNVDCNTNSISSLNLAANSDLVSLNASDNALTSIDLSNNLAISDVTLNNNQLTSLDFTNNSSLYQIIANDNNLTSITLPSSPTLLEIVWVYNNNLVNLDMTSAPILATLRFENNDLLFLDLRNGNNTNIHTMDARDNPGLQFICVDSVAYSTGASNWNKDASAQYTETCTLGGLENTFNAIGIYPNPVKDVLYIDNEDRLMIDKLEWINLTGQSTTLPVSREINISQFAAGIYFLKITLSDGQQQTAKILKK